MPPGPRQSSPADPPIVHRAIHRLCTQIIFSDVAHNRDESRPDVPGVRFGADHSATLRPDPGMEFGHLVVDLPFLGHQGFDLAVGVDDGGVVPAAEMRADLG
jgi:hypothetical protein